MHTDPAAYSRAGALLNACVHTIMLAHWPLGLEPEHPAFEGYALGIGALLELGGTFRASCTKCFP